MNKVKILWLIFIVANIYDALFSFIAWHYPSVVELNPIINFFRVDGYLSMLKVTLGLKLMLFSAVYFITQRVKHKTPILTIAVAVILLAVIWDTLDFFILGSFKTEENAIIIKAVNEPYIVWSSPAIITISDYLYYSPPPWYVQIAPDLILLLGIVSVVLILLRNFSKFEGFPRNIFPLLKDKLKVSSLVLTSAVFLGLSLYLYHLHLSYSHERYSNTIYKYVAIGNMFTKLDPTYMKYFTVPWYVNLWPEFLVIGLVLSGVSIYIWIRLWVIR
ncbi:hypothetical protein [Sulfurisphaera ohwakuensis]|uniref:Uncharacterized protein n=1 Tax=Sulfurisphaera ohwakuensis TaxID=69656 RepID=A0A650CKF1_SULOH|nr:hypothetical protein [Sulfurisphaera ohwakuensis]MBB5255207.1 hypothetical protein [Sulfurisphaera ohwakuensis]QGR18228.1 hypothetical protein D1869_14305 [Sulfurisphaera ohwakuensis]